MANSRIIANLSPSFIKVMPFECKGKNNITLTSYTNKFEKITKGLVCIFRAAETNDGDVRIKLSKIEKEIKLLRQNKEELYPGALRAGEFYEASYDGVDLILHEKALDIKAGTNVTIQKSKDNSLIISSEDTDTWRPIGDSLDSVEKDKSASLYSLNLLYRKHKAVEKIVNENKENINKHSEKLIIINKSLENIAKQIATLESELGKSNAEINKSKKKSQELEVEITDTKKELADLTKHVAEVGNNGFIKVQKNSHGFVTGDVLTLTGNVWGLTKANEIGVAICVVTDINNFLAIYNGIREYLGDVKDSLGKTVVTNTVYYCSGTPGKCTSSKPLSQSQSAFFVFENGGRKYIKNILKTGLEIDISRFLTGDVIEKKLAGKSDITHNHDTKYADKTETKNKFEEDRKLINGKANTSHGIHIPPSTTPIDNTKYLRADLTWDTVTLKKLGGLSSEEIKKIMPTALTLGVVSKAEIQKMLPTAATLGVVSKAEIQKMLPTAATLGVVSKAEIQKMLPTAATLGVISKAEIQKMMPNLKGYMTDGGTFGTLKLNNWIRTLGQSGWYSETYGGGIYMIDTTWVRIYNGKKFFIDNAEGDSIKTNGGLKANGELRTETNIFANGDLGISSDIRLKEQIEVIPNALEKLKKIRGVKYYRKDLGRYQVGVIAQEIQKVLPEVVHKNEETGFLSVSYGNIASLLIEAIKELNEKMEAR